MSVPLDTPGIAARIRWVVPFTVVVFYWTTFPGLEVVIMTYTSTKQYVSYQQQSSSVREYRIVQPVERCRRCEHLVAALQGLEAVLQEGHA